MSSTWTFEHVLALAPDSSSASAGQGLGLRGKWTELGRSDRAVWGLCKGSGKLPYQCRIDLGEPAFKCSCPSRKFPCKHGLGLLLVFAKEAKSFVEAAEPEWVSTWLDTRGEKAETKAAKAAAKAQGEAEKPVDPVAQAKRQAQRESRVRDGVGECRVWLEDLVRRGLAAAQSEPSSMWQHVAARMVDAQAPGLGVMIRQAGELISSGEGWQARTLDHLGRLHLLLTAAEKLETLPDDLAMDVRTALGYTQSKEETLVRLGVADRWAVIGQMLIEEDRLRTRRTWLIGRETGRRALVLDFAAGNQPITAFAPPGSAFDGELAFYPGRLELRALVKAMGNAGATSGEWGDAADATIETGLARYAAALALNPWLPRWPMLLEDVTPVAANAASNACTLVDREKRALPISPTYARSIAIWQLVAISGGLPIRVSGEWDGEFFTPMTVLASTDGASSERIDVSAAEEAA